MRKFALALLGVIKQSQYKAKNSNIPQQFLIQAVPYFSQWESPELVKGILTGNFDAKNDPNWKKSGAKNKFEYEIWSANACGLACTNR